MSKMRLQLNADAVEAIFNLMGEEAQLEMKQFVITEFTKRHLKPIVNHPVFEQAKRDIVQECDKIAQSKLEEFAEFKRNYYNNQRFDVGLKGPFKETLRKLVNEQAKKFVDESIEECINEAVEKLDLQPIVDRAVKNKVNKLLTEKVDKAIEERWSRVTSAVKEEL